ncbi:homoserine dehydrogenase-domain-containing protein [Dichotomocladium elegans]|nr:homoserine dehydrogenase-domain-containing protein [Dichotomocladium elegans]
MVNVGIVGAGLVGSELLGQLASTNAKRLKVVGLTNSRKMVMSDGKYTGLSLTQWKQTLEASETPADLAAFVKYLSDSPEHAVIVDCTASDAVSQLYPTWLSAGVSIVTPNKKGFSGSLALYKQIESLAANMGRGKTHTKPLVYHESTVGAGLPVLNTLADLVKTGDEIEKIEGIFSGTLSYLFNNFSSLSSSSTESFSANVKIAKELGYTEPDPRDDLNGMDVARKVTICGRLAGLSLDLKTLPVENIVPGPLQTVATAEEFMAKLPEFDAHFSALNEEAKKDGQVLRYVGLVDVKGGNSAVKLMRYPASHPFASLQGSDNIIKFTTKYFPNGLIIQGAGAGAAVTSFGIYSDLLKIQERVEGY